ncbi:MAG: Do family serine endopeptidase [Planctomycetota bacterium]|nr:Do family serine endopeptidase [Planctomycetota bacterium]
MTRFSSCKLWGFASAAVIGGAATFGTALWQQNVTGQESSEGPKTTSTIPDRIAKPAVENAKSLSLAFRHAAESATPSVVKISSHTNMKPAKLDRSGGPGMGENPFKGTPFEDMFRGGMPEGMGQGRVPQRDGIGSGVIIDSSGIVLTNNHVVEGADVVTVRLADGREFTATDIKTDPSSDLAVLRLKDAKNLPAAKIGDSDRMEIGDWVIAIGNPFELELTVSAGIISGKGRELNRVKRAKFLQTDAAINPGNSGGPLVNLDGEVVGINTAIASSTGGYQGVGFAIPMNLAKWVTSQLIERGSVQRGYLGVSIGALTKDLAEKLNAGSTEGALVGDVSANSPAAAAGVQAGDVIVAIGDLNVRTPGNLVDAVERMPLGSKQTLTVLRDGAKKNLTVVVKQLPGQTALHKESEPAASESSSKADTFSDSKLGFEVSDLTDNEKSASPGIDGVQIRSVTPDGPAASEGLRPGMIVRKVGRTEVRNVEEFAQAMKKELDEKGVLLHIRTSAGNRFVVVKPQ